MERPLFVKASFALALLSFASTSLFAQAPPPQPVPPPPPVPAEPTHVPGPVPPQEPLPVRKDQVTFDIAMRADLGGGRATGAAGSFEYEEGRFLIATGGVELKYRDLKLSADRIRVDIPANKLLAEGKVILDEGPRRLTGTTLDYDLTTRTGQVTDAIAAIDPDYYFRGASIAKVGPNTYTIDDGVFTSCNQEVPSWSIALSKASVTLEEYARISNARLRFKKLPVLYFPYLIWPATTERTSGFLIPKPGYSDRRGANLSLAYYKTLGRSADATFYADLSQEGYNGIGSEFRWRPSETSMGGLEAYFLSEPSDAIFEDPIFDPDRVVGDDRWKFVLGHDAKNLWNDFRGVVSIQKYSDFDYLKDIERSVDRQTQSFIYSNAFLSRNVGQSTFNILVDDREQVGFNRSRQVRRQLPEVEYGLRSIRLGQTSIPVYFSLGSGLHYFSVDLSDPPDANGETNTTSFRYGRAYLNPSLSIPLSTLSWLSVKVDVEGRATYWTDSLNQDRNAFSGDSLSRVVPAATAEIVGPSFSKIYDSPGGRYSKFKHVIEPRFDYGYVGTYDDQDRVSIFDEIDFVRNGHFWAAGVYNRLLAKPSDESQGGAFTIASLLIAQAFNLDDQPGQSSQNGLLTTAAGPVFAELQVNPSRNTSIKADLQYNTLFNELMNFNFSGSTKLGEHTIGATWYKTWNAESGEDQSDQMRAFLDVAILPGRFNVGAELSYDAALSELLSQRYVLSWSSECYGWNVELREANYRQITERDYRFSFTLKNVGTFLDLNDSF